LLKGKEGILRVKGRAEFDIPNVDEGKHEIQSRGEGFEDREKIRIERMPLVFLETDKPI